MSNQRILSSNSLFPLADQGVFETILVRKKRIFKLKEHIERLFASAKTLQIEFSISKEDLEKIILQRARESNFENIYIRVSITPGADPIIITKKFIPYPEELYRRGVEIGIVTTRRIHESLDSRTKNQDFLSNILAKIEAIEEGFFEGVMCDDHGFLTEGTISNIFLIRDRILLTPPGINILKGITRNTVMDLANKAGIKTYERMLTRYDAYTADEVFLTYTSVGILPVTRIDGQTIGTGTPGPLTQRLMELYQETFWQEAVPI